MISQRQPPESAPARTYLGRVVPGYMLHDAQMVAGEGLAGPIPGLTRRRESGVMEGGSLVPVTVGAQEPAHRRWYAGRMQEPCICLGITDCGVQIRALGFQPVGRLAGGWIEPGCRPAARRTAPGAPACGPRLSCPAQSWTGMGPQAGHQAPPDPGLRRNGQMPVSVCSRTETNQDQLRSKCPRLRETPAALNLESRAAQSCPSGRPMEGRAHTPAPIVSRRLRQ
jgi:hypothetical protein